MLHCLLQQLGHPVNTSHAHNHGMGAVRLTCNKPARIYEGSRNHVLRKTSSENQHRVLHWSPATETKGQTKYSKHSVAEVEFSSQVVTKKRNRGPSLTIQLHLTIVDQGRYSYSMLLRRRSHKSRRDTHVTYI